MKQKLKYILPVCLIMVLIWGLLEVAEKAAVLISITALTSYLFYQFREDKKFRYHVLTHNHVSSDKNADDQEYVQIANSVDFQARGKLTELLRISLKLNQGRFKQDVEDVNRIADRLVEAVESGILTPEDCPDLCRALEEISGRIKRVLVLYDEARTDSTAHDEIHDIQAEIRKIGLELKGLLV